jgi:hypothetical protein
MAFRPSELTELTELTSSTGGISVFSVNSRPGMLFLRPLTSGS